MTYSSEVLTDSPLAYYRMGEASGTTLVDSSANNRNGTYAGGVALGATGLLGGDVDTAASFDGFNDTANAGSATWMQHTAAITVEAVAKPDLPTPSSEYTLGARVVSFDRWRFSIANSKLKFTVNVSGLGAQSVTGATTLTAGTTYHVAATFDGSALRVYLNGVLDGSLSASGTINQVVSADLNIGNRAGGTLYDGVMDEFAVYDTALSGTRIAAHYAAMDDPPPTTDGAYYRVGVDWTYSVTADATSTLSALNGVLAAQGRPERATQSGNRVLVVVRSMGTQEEAEALHNGFGSAWSQGLRTAGASYLVRRDASSSYPD